MVCSSSFDFTDIYFLVRSRERCKQYGKDIYPFKGARFTELRISPSQVLSLIKLLKISVSARDSAKDTAVSYKTALKAYDLLRRILVEDLPE